METTNFLTLLCCVSMFYGAVSVERRVSWGKNFILAFMEQYVTDGEAFMYVAAEENTTIHVIAPYINMNRTIQISPGLQKISLHVGLRNRNNELAKKRMHVIADKHISLYVLDSWSQTRYIEGYLALPISALSTGYIVCSDYADYETGISMSEFVIAAVENNTNVTITFKTNGSVSIGGYSYASRDKYTLNMSSFDTLQIQHTHDLTGTMIQSDKVVAVFAGNKCGYGVGRDDCQPEVEQMVPIELLGHEYITVPLYPADLYRYRIVSPYNNTVVSVKNQSFTLGSGEFVERHDRSPQYIRSSKPVMIIEYGQCNYGNCVSESTPSMITIPSISNFSSNYTFGVDNFIDRNSNNSTRNFLFVIIDSNSSENLMLDQARLNPTRKYILPDTNSKNYSVLVASIGVGPHTLYHPEETVKYGAILYGTGYRTSYGFPLGFSLADRLKEAIKAECDSNRWRITVDMPQLNQVYPRSIASSIFLGDNSCTGNLVGNILQYSYGITTCNTQEVDTGNSVRYTNTLLYAYFDPNHPNIIRGYNWTIDLVCDLHKSGSLMTGISHNQPGHHTQINITNEYSINMTFFTDPNFLHELPGNPLHVKVGSDVYVKVFTDTPDWNIKMRLHTCYVQPFKNSSEIFYLMKSGCEMDVNTHIISQSTHETKFMFRDFEFSTNHNGLYMFCEANFCTSNDFSPHCQQVCSPGQTRRIRRNTNTPAAQVLQEIFFIH